MNRFNTPSKKLAFTLAEVLITLGIIGIVAEMTIPTLMASYEKQVQVTQLRKFYSSFSQGLKTYIANEDCSDMACTGLFVGKRQDASWEAKVDQDIRTVFRVTKSCPSYTSGCDTTTVTYLDKSPIFNSFYYGHSFVTPDNVLFMVYDTNASNCQNNITDPPVKLSSNCGAVYVDINGVKRPNQWGRDIFNFYIANDGSLYANGSQAVAELGGALWTTDPAQCGTAGVSTLPATVTGVGCAARIIDEGWTMKY